MIRESLADSNQIQWQVLAKSLLLQLADSRLWQVLYIYSIYKVAPSASSLVLSVVVIRKLLVTQH